MQMIWISVSNERESERRNTMSGRRYEIDMCNGPLFGKILTFSIPLILSGILQLLFNAADMVVAGRFAGSVALGAVGATSSLINLLINVFVGMSVGTNVLVAHFYGANRQEELGQTVHTSIGLSLISGVILGVGGYILASPLLSLMGTPDDILPHAVIYMQIYFIGVPGMLLYNFGSAILRAVGDTKRPLYYLLFAGVINVILNVVFIVVTGMGVEGVALATIISQFVSAGLVIRCLIVEQGAYRLEIRKIRLYKDKVIRILRVGLPAGFQGAVFSISNVLIQSSVNSFGSIAVAGNTAASNLEGFVYNAMNSFHQTAVNFTGQNVGAHRYDRVKKIFWICMGSVAVTGAALSAFVCGFGRQLLSVYITDAPEAIGYGLLRFYSVASLYFLCGMMDVSTGMLRGLGASVAPMVICLMGACGFRVLWVATVFPRWSTPQGLFLCYPISWTVTLACQMVAFFAVYRRQCRSAAIQN